MCLGRNPLPLLLWDGGMSLNILAHLFLLSPPDIHFHSMRRLHIFTRVDLAFQHSLSHQLLARFPEAAPQAAVCDDLLFPSSWDQGLAEMSICWRRPSRVSPASRKFAAASSRPGADHLPARWTGHPLMFGQQKMGSSPGCLQPSSRIDDTLTRCFSG